MEKLYLVLIPAIIGAISGLLASYWQSRYSVKSQDFSKRIEELCDSIRKLEEISCLYWSHQENSQNLNISVPYIIGLKTKIGILVDYLDDEYSNFHKESISKRLTDFYSACTGGDFGSASKKVAPDRQRDILITGERLKIDLIRTRNELY